MNCVVVPVYKEFNSLSDGELASLKQLLKVLGRHPIVFVTYRELNVVHYVNYSERCGGDNIHIQLFDKKYFLNIDGYNKLLISFEFYTEFKRFHYILIYQLDAWVFRDELNYWCDKGYDYIGAPWFEGYSLTDSTSKFISSGNGGFSLRNVQSTLRVLRQIKLWRWLRWFWYKTGVQRIFRIERILNQRFGDAEITQKVLFNYFAFNEDYFWCRIIAKSFKSYRLAPFPDATKFSFEVNPSHLYELNDNKLPFGCHAWERFESDFWERFIK